MKDSLKISLFKVEKNGKTYFRTKGLDGTWRDVVFVNKEDIPEEACIIYTDEDNSNEGPNSNGYSTIWIRKVLKTEAYSKKSSIADLFPRG